MMDSMSSLKIMNAYQSGNYDQLLSGNDFDSLNHLESLLLDIYQCRTQVALNPTKPLNFHGKKLNPSIESILLLNTYFCNLSNHKDTQTIMTTMSELVRRHSNRDDGSRAENQVHSSQVILSAVILYFNEQMYEEAYQLLSTSPSPLEYIEPLHQALLATILLKIKRVDLAASVLSEMEQKYDDHICTLFVKIQYAQSQTGQRDTLYFIQDLIEAYGRTPLLLNLLVSAIMFQNHEFEEASKLLSEICQFNPSVESDPNILMNLILVNSWLGIPSVEYLESLKNKYPNHSLIRDFTAKSDLFDQLVQRYI